MKDYEVAELISPQDKKTELSPRVALEQRWARSLEKLLPIPGRNPFWRYSRIRSSPDAYFGWKIHVSATILEACSVLEVIGPALAHRNILFKAPSTLSRLMTLNSGIIFGYSQIGKFITIFPGSKSEFLGLLNVLEPGLERWSDSPPVPFDIRLGTSCIYYRYGSFVHETSTIPAIGDGSSMIEDTRDHRMFEYSIANDPLNRHDRKISRRSEISFPARYLVRSALSQRGKGGVYSAIDIGSSPPRQCVIKEGRLNGETTWRGLDGRRRVQNEAKVLSLLSDRLPVPKIFDSFERSGNYYLVLEQIDGTRLDRIKLEQVTIRDRLDLARQLCAIVDTVHRCGWLWRDCKPQNVFVDSNGLLRPIDFEGACPIDSPDPEAWSTLTFSNDLLTSTKYKESPVSLDLYQLRLCLSWLLLETDRSTDETYDLRPERQEGGIRDASGDF